jgi:hypothetical protein
MGTTLGANPGTGSSTGVSTDTATPPPTFAQTISNSDSLQFIGVIANCSGIISSTLAVISFIQGLTEPNNSQILNAIEQLQQTLNADFTALGNLIQQQTQIIVDTVNRDGMALALSNSDVAMAQIQDFLSNNNDSLVTAEADSVAGISFFSELDLTAPADLLFFLPGLVKAGTVRVFVIASEPLKDREPTDVIVENITAMITLLSAMIDSVVSTITAAHTINTKSHTIRCSALQQVVEANTPYANKPDFDTPYRTVTVIDGYYHKERGIILQFFDAQRGNPPCEQPTGFEEEALAAAEQARTQGISDELSFIGIPQFQLILQSWQNLITVTPPAIDLNGHWLVNGTPGPIISVDGIAISIDMSAYNRPTATGAFVDSNDITVTFPDEGALAGKLVPPKAINWSNNTTWIKERVTLRR